MNCRFVALDRDGTLIVERNYLSDPREVELLKGAAGGLLQMRRAGLGLILITNQSDIGRGLFDEARLDLIHQRLCRLLEREGVYLDRIFFCPHLPAGRCPCRKPETGLLDQAAKNCGFDVRVSFVVGDKASDIEMGQRAGATTLLVRTGYGAEVDWTSTCTPDYSVDGLLEAAQIIDECINEKEPESEILS